MKRLHTKTRGLTNLARCRGDSSHWVSLTRPQGMGRERILPPLR